MPRTNSKKVGTVAPRGPVPSIAEISEVIRDHIQMLIDGAAVPSAKSMAAIRRNENWQPSLAEVEDKSVLREIAVLGRALELLKAVADLNLVPRGTTPTAL